MPHNFHIRTTSFSGPLLFPILLLGTRRRESLGTKLLWFEHLQRQYLTYFHFCTWGKGVFFALLFVPRPVTLIPKMIFEISKERGEVPGNQLSLSGQEGRGGLTTSFSFPVFSRFVLLYPLFLNSLFFVVNR